MTTKMQNGAHAHIWCATLDILWYPPLFVHVGKRSLVIHANNMIIAANWIKQMSMKCQQEPKQFHECQCELNCQQKRVSFASPCLSLFSVSTGLGPGWLALSWYPGSLVGSRSFHRLETYLLVEGQLTSQCKVGLKFTVQVLQYCL